ncbi:MAG: phage tail protein [Caldilineaceae bacterium]
MAEIDKITQDLVAQSHVAFRYLVEIDGTRMAAFTECTLPSIEWEIEEVKEGGLNTYVHQLPGRRKGARLTLKHGIAKGVLLDWYLKTLSEQFETKTDHHHLVEQHQRFGRALGDERRLSQQVGPGRNSSRMRIRLRFSRSNLSAARLTSQSTDDADD